MQHKLPWTARGAFLSSRPCHQCLHFNSTHRRCYRGFDIRRAAKATAKAKTAESDQKAAKRREKEQGRSTYSPQSYKELLEDAVQSVEYALEDGVKRMEVDFPTLSGDSESLLLPPYCFKRNLQIRLKNIKSNSTFRFRCSQELK